MPPGGGGGGSVNGPGASTNNGFAKWNGTSGDLLKDSPATIVNADIDAAAAIAVSKLAVLTASRAVVSDGSGILSVSAATATEVGYLSGATSSIQTQLNGKMANPMTTGGDLIYAGASGTPMRLANGSAGQVLSSQGGTSAPSWASPGGTLAYRSVTSTDTCTNADYTLSLSGASFTETLFTAVGNAGKILVIKHSGTSLTQVYTLNTTGGQTIGGVTSGAYALYTNGETLTIQSDGSNWVILGHLTSTEWVSAGAITFGAVTTAPTKGTVSVDRLLWRREGDSADLKYEYYQTNATGAAAGSGGYFLTLPTNMTADSNKCSIVAPTLALDEISSIRSYIGQGYLGNLGSASGDLLGFLYSTTQIWARAGDWYNTANVWGSGYYPLNGGSYSLGFIATVPISGWRP